MAGEKKLLSRLGSEMWLIPTMRSTDVNAACIHDSCRSEWLSGSSNDANLMASVPAMTVSPAAMPTPSSPRPNRATSVLA